MCVCKYVVVPNELQNICFPIYIPFPKLSLFAYTKSTTYKLKLVTLICKLLKKK